MSCMNNIGTTCISPSHFSNQYVSSLGNLPRMERRFHVRPLSFSYCDRFTAINGNSTSHSQVSRKFVCQAKGNESDGNLSLDGTVVDEQTLERNLQKAVEEENYAKAAKIRDSLRFLQEDSKASVLATNARFYNCFRSGDLPGMQSLWAKRDNVCCVHPGVSGISGYDLVMGSWEFVCSEYGFPIEIDVKDVEVYVKGDIGYVTCIEVVKTKATNNWGKQFATNVFEKINDNGKIPPLGAALNRRSIKKKGSDIMAPVVYLWFDKSLVPSKRWFAGLGCAILLRGLLSPKFQWRL